jgi:hypothetical protein
VDTSLTTLLLCVFTYPLHTTTEYEIEANKLASAWRAQRARACHAVGDTATAATIAAAEAVVAAAAANAAAAAAAAASTTTAAQQTPPVLAPPPLWRGPPECDAPLRAAIERDYWRVVNTGSAKATVEYGNDLDVQVHGSGFPAPAAQYMAGAGMDRTAPVDFSDPNYYKTSG